MPQVDIENSAISRDGWGARQVSIREPVTSLSGETHRTVTGKAPVAETTHGA